ncbi:hypothetical protein KIN20_030837 [Parelaphostrongylus tenuis]|uniref:Uncharacterized protein n=1 Tax=Parelaphostrongylus tenuis TaxID=148309 RepID=A0AAD5WGT1_PARTN|nr:hypothetical protein KIN20_030837 [Parelaphostrongylus tenuis]
MEEISFSFFEALENHGRAAFLPDPVISIISGQLTVSITYEPLKCQGIALKLDEMVPGVMDKLPHCIIFGNTVTALCTAVPAAPPPPNNMCDLDKNQNIVTVPSEHISISGASKTTNVVMANWSREMWQNVVNRAVRMLPSGPFGSHFFPAFASVS